MSSYDHVRVLDRVGRRRLNRTAEWLLDDEKFVAWRTQGCLMWLLGKGDATRCMLYLRPATDSFPVGSGKTILMCAQHDCGPLRWTC